MSVLDLLKNGFRKPRREIKADAGEIPDEKAERVSTLSPREYEAYLILLDGFTLRYTAEQMGIKYPTANTYVNSIYRKLGISSRAQLILNYKDVRLDK